MFDCKYYTHHYIPFWNDVDQSLSSRSMTSKINEPNIDDERIEWTKIKNTGNLGRIELS